MLVAIITASLIVAPCIWFGAVVQAATLRLWNRITDDLIK